MRHDWTSFTTWTSAPIGCGKRFGLARDDERRVVLLRAVEFVRKLIVDPDAVDLRRRLVHLRRPRATAVSRNVAPPSFAWIMIWLSLGLIQMS